MAIVLAALTLLAIPVHTTAWTPARSNEILKHTLDEDSACVQETSLSLLQKQAQATKAGAIHSEAGAQEPEAGEEASEGETGAAEGEGGEFEVEQHVVGPDGELVPLTQVTSTTSPPEHDPTLKCMQNTGGTCSDQRCADWRGPTRCSSGRCFCMEGYCSTVEGKCVLQEDQQVLHNFTLRNARYPDQYLYISAYRRAVLVSSRVDKQSRFDLFMPPGQGDNRTGGATEFFLGSEKYDMWVAAVGKGADCFGDGMKTNCQQRTEVAAVPVQGFSTTDVLGLALNIYMAPEYQGEPKYWDNHTQSVMIESYRYPRHFFSLSSLSWGVQATYGDGGAGSYWIPEPKIPMPLKPYVGKRCSFDCGFYGSGAAPVLAPAIIGLCSFLACLICCGCWCAAPRQKSVAG